MSDPVPFLAADGLKLSELIQDKQYNVACNYVLGASCMTFVVESRGAKEEEHWRYGVMLTCDPVAAAHAQHLPPEALAALFRAFQDGMIAAFGARKVAEVMMRNVVESLGIEDDDEDEGDVTLPTIH